MCSIAFHRCPEDYRVRPTYWVMKWFGRKRNELGNAEESTMKEDCNKKEGAETPISS
jgi:hypothetical protein